MSEHEAEPWLRGTHTDIDPVRRAILHSLELSHEDIVRWTRNFDGETLEMEPMGLPSIGFQMRHIARSIDRLQTYAMGGRLHREQLSALQTECTPNGSREEMLAELMKALHGVLPFMMAFSLEELQQTRSVGRADLPTTLAGLLFHIAEHTQRHVGQLITTAKVIESLGDAQRS